MFIIKHSFSQENYNSFSCFPNFLTDYFWDSEKHKFQDFPGGPMVKTPRFHCKGCRFDPWSGKFCFVLFCFFQGSFACCGVRPKTKTKTKIS